jgi:hypothetical protein
MTGTNPGRAAGAAARPEWRFGLESDLIPGHDPVSGLLLRFQRPVAVVIEVNGYQAEFQGALHFLQNATVRQNKHLESEQRGPLAGPETAAEHVRNALMLYDGIERENRETWEAKAVDRGSPEYIEFMAALAGAWSAARARLGRALAALEG